MKVISFNINSIRARLHQVEAIISRYQPDVIGLQETKVVDAEFPFEAIEALGYRAEIHGQKGHYGVALLIKQKPEWVVKGFPTDTLDAQKRFIGCSITQPNGRQLCVFNGYFPQGESQDHLTKYPAKRQFYSDLNHYLTQNLGDDHDFLVMGDMNVAPEDEDVGIGADSVKRWLKTGKCSFLAEERQWLQDLVALGLNDTYRQHHPDQQQYSWFDYRSKGFEREEKRGLRIDFILANMPLLDRCIASGIDYDIRAMEKPSDHCPVWAEFSI